ncbi:hypothetical protein CLOLEP_01452 [[Clostridium] leptum DSM 753]|jgi:hypothetical protein|uniref:Uncharacterized protein n=1 Tax=[Clostridium] leptum DSM 753 TaxID=428125 RepID=A7VSB1_9FIRM|nr:hypothetical protein CLOLEP_01452 [[Clostridium] leptum DSM 753]
MRNKAGFFIASPPHKREQRAGSGREPFTSRFLPFISFFIFFSFWEEACFPASSLFLF